MIIATGIDGIEHNTPLPPAIDLDLYAEDETLTKKLTPLPNSLDKAISLAKNSVLAKSVMGEELFEKYLSFKESEAVDYAAAKDKKAFYQERYFNLT